MVSRRAGPDRELLKVGRWFIKVAETCMMRLMDDDDGDATVSMHGRRRDGSSW